MLLPNFKQIQQNPTDFYTFFYTNYAFIAFDLENQNSYLPTHKHRYTAQTCSQSVGFLHACSCNYLLIGCHLLQMYLFPFPIFSAW